MYVSVYQASDQSQSSNDRRSETCTSTVSKTLITPGWRNVRSFFSAFFASGSRDLFAVMSKEKILQSDPSSCGACQVLARLARRLST